MILLLACTATPDSAFQDHLTEEALREVAEQVVGLGPRTSGTPVEEQARALMQTLFEEAGLSEVRSEPFDWTLWSREGEATLTVGNQVLPGMAWSPSPGGTLTGVLAQGEVTGRIALSRSGEVSRAEAFAQAWLGGALGLVHISEEVDADGTDLVEVGHTLDGVSLPAMAVSAASGEELAPGKTVTLDIAASTRPHTSSNVLGLVPGSSEGLGPIFVTAHYDSWDISECAFDNGLGAAGLVLLARQLAQGPPPSRTVVFLAMAAEEQGVQGAQAWVAQNEEWARAGALVLNLDVMWSAEGSYWINADKERHRDLAIEVATQEGLEPRDGGAPSPSSDHLAFQGRGVPAFWATRQPDRHYHTTHDRLEFLDLEQSAAALRVNWALLADEAGL